MRKHSFWVVRCRIKMSDRNDARPEIAKPVATLRLHETRKAFIDPRCATQDSGLATGTCKQLNLDGKPGP
jgi:hypothetical protein